MVNWPLSEREAERLAVRAAQGDRGAFGALVQRYYPELLQWVRRRWSEGVVDPEDVVQETFLRAWRRRHLYRSAENGSWLGWCCQIALRVVIDHWRRAQRLEHALQRAGMNDPERWIDPAPTPEQQVVQAEVRAALARRLARLRPRYRELLMLWAEGASTGAIQERLSMPRNTVRTLLYRAREQLRRTMLPYRSDS